jgi:integrase
MARGTGFGTVEKRDSGRYRARYVGPDGRRYTAPTMFVTKTEAKSWLALRHSEIIRKAWQPPEAETPKLLKLTFADYADQWMAERLVNGEPLKPRTKAHYRQLLDQHLDNFANLPLASITADDVRKWHAKLDAETPTLRAHCYGLLHAIMTTAASHGLIDVNPCVIRGAGTSRRAITIRPATLPELEMITNEMPERYQLMVLLASWCALRFGELVALRRMDIDTSGEVVRVHRGVVRVDGELQAGRTKSTAGVRDVAIPPHLMPMVQRHLTKHVGGDNDSLLFQAHHGGHLAASTFKRHFFKAREAAGRPDLRFHDLRHSGAVLAAATGATLAELMARLGHSTPAAALRYQHAAKGRDREIAALLSKLASNGGES